MGLGGLLNRGLTNYATGGGLLSDNPEAQTVARRAALMGFGQNMLKMDQDVGGALEAGGAAGLRSGFAKKGEMDEQRLRQARQSYLSGDEMDVGERYDNAIQNAFQAGDMDAVRSLSEVAKSLNRGASRNRNAAPVYRVGVDPNDPKKKVYFKLDGTQANQVEGMEASSLSGPTGGRGTGARLIDIRNPDGSAGKMWVDINTDMSQIQPFHPISEAGQRAAFHAPMVVAANKQLADMEAPSRLDSIFQKYGVYEALPEELQLSNQAGLAVVDAYLRATTGAAYNKEEMSTAVKLLTPQPGDTRGTLAQKAEMRDMLQQAIERTALGHAYTRPKGGDSRTWQELERIKGTKGTKLAENVDAKLVNGVDPASLVPEGY